MIAGCYQEIRPSDGLDSNDGGSSYIDIIISPELMEPTSPVDPNLPTEPGGGSNSGTTPEPNVCDCCGKNPCECEICRCCGKKNCECICPEIKFQSIFETISGFYSGYVFYEGWGVSYGGCEYDGYVSSNSSGGFNFSASIGIMSPNHSAKYYGTIEYFEDEVSSGGATLNGESNSSGSLYDDKQTFLGSYNGVVTRLPCSEGKLQAALGFTIYEWLSPIYKVNIFNGTYLITIKI